MSPVGRFGVALVCCLSLHHMAIYFLYLGVPVIRLLQPSSYEDDDLERQNDDKQDSVKIDCHDFTSMVCCRF
jgi:hypothetical protein